jgi:hypothetical protein
MSARPWAKIVGLEIAVLALIALGIGGLIRGASGADDDDTMASPPVVTVELSTVTPAIAADYHYAADHLADVAQIPCYCGCDRSLNHRNLADCYVTPTGAWDAHASGCVVCGNETATVREQLAAGAPIADVRDSIIAQYGPPPSLFNSGASS